MSKRVWKISALVLAVAAVLVAAAFLAAKHRCPHVGKRLVRTILRQPYAPGREIEFRWQMSASGTTPDGARFDDSRYLSSDYVELTVTHYSFPTVGVAKESLDQSARTARTIYFKSVQPDTETNHVGERIVLSTQSQEHYEVFHRNGSRLLQIDSSSLNHALEYERRLGIHGASSSTQHDQH